MEKLIPFNSPFLTGKETDYIQEAVLSQKISGDGIFTKQCHAFFEKRYDFLKCLLTTSCTDALEMAALLIDVQPGDEVIVPAYTFVSTANAFVLRGAKIIFADSRSDHPNIEEDSLESLISPRTKAIVPVHYAGIACDMDKINALAARQGIYVVEDAAQAIDSFYKDRPLGSCGHLAAFSFHETKNVIAGEGGMLTINDSSFIKRAEIIREKGTNRSQFFRGEIDKYGWVDIGSSFLPSDIIAAFLYAQLEQLDAIQRKRKLLWNAYYEQLSPLAAEGLIELPPPLPDYATNNAHMFYVICRDAVQRDQLIAALKQKRIMAVFHYISLHTSSYYALKHDGRSLPNCERFSDCLLRLPMYFELSLEDIERITSCIKQFFLGA